MHILFIPYGKRSEVELLLRDMEAQKHWMKCRKDGKEKVMAIQAQVRQLPAGIYEYVCPREDLDAVLTTLRFNFYDDRYTIKGRKILGFDVEKVLKKLLVYESVPKFKTDKKYLWVGEKVGIVPIGIRKDGDIVEPIEGEFFGWEHEGI